MATVSSFEGLARPNKSELRQFAELFMPLFQASSEEARRQAVAGLSQCKVMPQAVCLFVGCQPISIAAPFLVSSTAISDDTLIAIARTQGAEHGKAIVNRANLSPKVIDALVALRHAEPRRQMTAAAQMEDGIAEELLHELVSASSPTGRLPITADEPEPAAEAAEATAAENKPAEDIPFEDMPSENKLSENKLSEDMLADREAEMRVRLKDLAGHMGRRDDDRLGLRSLSTLQQALLVRFARQREASQFATALADALSTSRWLVRRIMLDISGRQLAMTLTSLGSDFLDTIFILERFYPHLADMQHGVTRAWLLLDGLDPEECNDRVEAWRRADAYTYDPQRTEEPVSEQPFERSDAQPGYRLLRRSR